MKASVKNKLMDKLEYELRNAEIRITWDVLKLLEPKWTYTNKIEYLAKEFNIGAKRIEGILYE